MSDAGGNEETTDYSKMKVNDLKKILKNRGLPLTGNKQELVERLQTSEASPEDLLDGSEVGDELVEDVDLEKELDETSLIGDDSVMDKSDEKKGTPVKDTPKEAIQEPASSSPAKIPSANDSVANPSEENPTNGAASTQPEVPNATQQKRKISLKPESTAASEAAKKKLRAERFGVGNATNEKTQDTSKDKDLLAKRAERFAINSTTTSTAVPDKSKLPPNEVLKKRAERFGILSPAEMKRQHLEKLQARKLRFQSSSAVVSSTTTGATATTTATATISTVPVLPTGTKVAELSAEERKKLRAQRFKLN